VAGESPDRSERKQSPGSPSGDTSAAGGDPRRTLSGAGAPEQHTAVLPLPPGESAPFAAPERSGTGTRSGRGSEAARRRDPGTETGTREGDAELRSAVAAWVASADGETGARTGSSGAPGASGAAGRAAEAGPGPSEPRGASAAPSRPAAGTAPAPRPAPADETAVMPATGSGPEPTVHLARRPAEPRTPAGDASGAPDGGTGATARATAGDKTGEVPGGKAGESGGTDTGGPVGLGAAGASGRRTDGDTGGDADRADRAGSGGDPDRTGGARASRSTRSTGAIDRSGDEDDHADHADGATNGDANDASDASDAGEDRGKPRAGSAAGADDEIPSPRKGLDFTKRSDDFRTGGFGTDRGARGGRDDHDTDYDTDRAAGRAADSAGDTDRDTDGDREGDGPRTPPGGTRPGAAVREVDQPTAIFQAVRRPAPDTTADRSSDRSGKDADAPRGSGGTDDGGARTASRTTGTATGSVRDPGRDSGRPGDARSDDREGGSRESTGDDDGDRDTTTSGGKDGDGARNTDARNTDVRDTGREKPTAGRDARTDAPSGDTGGSGRTPAAGATAGRAVDTPTTALKLPPAPRPADPAPAGRPSRVVPLRGTDDPRTPRTPGTGTASGTAAPAAPGDGAGPRAATGPSAPAAGPGPETASPERTTQQPVPPLPPMDLLAELTNKPETKLRSVVRRVKIWTPLLVLLIIVLGVVQIVRPLPEQRLELTAEPVFTFKGGKLALPFPAGDGQGAVEVEGVGTVATYGAQKPAPIASVAKTMTAYVILRDHPIKGEETGERIEVDQQAEDEAGNKDESTAKMTAGHRFTQRELLQLLMIPSANNAARLLARWDAGSEEAFIKKMNEAAKDLGMNDTVYTDPSGFRTTTVSTPLDQLKLAKAAMRNDVFREIVNTTLADIPGSGPVRNANDRALLKPGVGGIKTGSSTPAGGNLLWAANADVDGEIRRIVGITMGVQQAPSLTAKRELAITHSIGVIESAQDALFSAPVIRKGQVVGQIDNGMGRQVPVVATKDLKAVGWAGLRIEVTLGDGGKNLPRSARAGEVIGEISIGTGPGRATAPVALRADLTEPGFADRLTRIG
jgi:serine-type D-Ala-D-Ala carboxypeptidase (penicillin-binding protein 5/6)